MPARMNPAGAPMPWPYPTAIGVLNNIAEIGADPVSVRNSTPTRPTAPPLSFWTSARSLTSTLSTTGSMPSWWGGMTFSSVLTSPLLSGWGSEQFCSRVRAVARTRSGNRGCGRLPDQLPAIVVSKHVEQHLLDGSIPSLLTQPSPIREQRARLDVRVARLRESIEGLDRRGSRCRSPSSPTKLPIQSPGRPASAKMPPRTPSQ